MTGNARSDRAETAAGVTFGLGAAALGLFATSRPLVGVAVYAAAAAVAVGVLWRSPATYSLHDDWQSPAGVTLTAVGLASAVVFPVLTAADGLGYFAWGPTTAGAAMAVAALYVLYSVVSLGWLGVTR